MLNKKSDVDPILKWRFGLPKRINMYERLKSYTEEGFPVYDSLLKFRARYEKNKDFRAKIITIWLEKMQHGASFTTAIKGWVPESELNLISAGETGRGIDKGLHEAIVFANSAKKIKSVIVGGSMYPVILLLVVLGFIAMFSLQMAPTYSAILPVERWPDLGQNLYGFSNFIVTKWYILLLVLGATSTIISMTISKWTGKTREFFDKLPPWSVYKVYQGCSFLISLASMMQSGTPLNDALKKLKSTSSPWLAEYIEEMMRNLRRGGKNFGQHLNVGLLDSETAGDVIDYSDLGKFEEAVYAIGERNLQESVAKIEMKMAVARNLMLVLVGVTVGLIYYTSIELNGAVADAATTATQSQAGITK